MARAHYLGILLGEAELGAQTDARGRFLPLAEPMPVGSTIEVDGTPLRISRIDEGAQPGCWLIAEGAPMPIIDEAPTNPTPPTHPEPGAPVATITANESGPEGGKKKKRRGNKTILGR